MIRAALPRAFNTLVRGNLEVKRLPPEEEPGAPGAYGGAGSIDGKIPGKFWINLRTTDLHSKYSLPDLAPHEAIPGHVWQGEYAQQAAADPHAARVQRLFRRLGALRGAARRRARRLRRLPVGRLGYLQSIAFRACRLVVDTGFTPRSGRASRAWISSSTATGRIRSKWRAKSIAIAAGRGRRAATRSATATSTACATSAKAELGAKYDLRAFDDAVVLGGNVPMDVLAKNVDDYIHRRCGLRQLREVGRHEASCALDRKQRLARVETKRPVSAAHRREQQLVHQVVKWRVGICFREKQPHAVQEHARDRLVIAFGVTVHAANALVEAANEPGSSASRSISGCLSTR